jgi:rhodanese-related sulfurtransferase
MAWDDVSRWQPVELFASFKMGDAVQPVDVRDRGYRDETEQIRKTIRIDPMEFEKEIAGLPDDTELIFYCERPGEATAMKIALWAFDHGKRRVGVLIGGWPAWQAAGYPTEPKPA